MTSKDYVLCVGEIVWDSLPEGLFLGGSPLNVAFHLRKLNIPTLITSRVGDDILGTEVKRRLQQNGISTELIQTDPKWPTGLTIVNIDCSDQPTYVSNEPAAWDRIEQTEALMEAACKARMIVFGSPGMRAVDSRRTIQNLIELGENCVFDINLRPPRDSKNIVSNALQEANILKINDQEMLQLAQWFSLPDSPKEFAAAIAHQFNIQTICITQGPKGNALWQDGSWQEQNGYTVEVEDTVGCGDAFLAGLLASQLSGLETNEALQLANVMGALVASKKGALPELGIDSLKTLQQIGTRMKEA